MLNIRKDVSLSPYTTFKIGGPARYFAEAHDDEEIRELCHWAGGKKIPVFVLGGGSNVLISDSGFDGLVIKIQNSKFIIRDSKIIAEAGVPLSKLVLESVNAGLSGLEWAVGIPGTISGAVCGNSGAYGHSISEVVDGIKAMDSGGKIFDLDKSDCRFCYRGGIFKEKGNESIILEVKIDLVKGDVVSTGKRMKEIIAERTKKIPPYPSAGSFFKNYVVKKENDPLLQKFPDLKVKGGKIATAYLIEQCGLKGMKIGGAMIPDEHSNFIVNCGGAAAKDVLALAEICKEKVKEKYGIDLEIEKKLIGF